VDQELLRMLARAVNPGPKIQVNKPPTFHGKDRSRFRSWWLAIEAYMDLHQTSFPNDASRISWISTFLTDTAQEWHQKRVRAVKELRMQDRWEQYVDALTERFTDPGQRHRDLKEMKSLSYKGDISQYLTRLQDLNMTVQWSGTSMQDLIACAVPNKIMELVYSRRGGVPDVDEDFLDAVMEAGQIYENMLADPALTLKKDGSGSTKEQPKPDNSRRDKRSPSGQNPSSKSKKDRPKASAQDDSGRKWPNNREALKGIDQADIDKRKKDNKACWRCGRDNHQTLNCFAKKDVNGKELPQPAKVAGTTTKRSAEEDLEEEALPPTKKAKVDALAILQDEPPRIFELSDSDEEDEMDF
jgi:hypothetical protein